MFIAEFGALTLMRAILTWNLVVEPETLKGLFKYEGVSGEFFLGMKIDQLSKKDKYLL